MRSRLLYGKPHKVLRVAISCLQGEYTLKNRRSKGITRDFKLLNHQRERIKIMRQSPQHAAANLRKQFVERLGAIKLRPQRQCIYKVTGNMPQLSAHSSRRRETNNDVLLPAQAMEQSLKRRK